METERPQFSIYVRTYFWMFFAVVCMIPVVVGKVAVGGGPIAFKYSGASLAWFIATALLFWFAQAHCSSERLQFQDGLLYVTASMMTGWTYLSFATILPALATAFYGSVGMALVGKIRRDKNYAQKNFSKLVRFFYQHRLRH